MLRAFDPFSTFDRRRQAAVLLHKSAVIGRRSHRARRGSENHELRNISYIKGIDPGEIIAIGSSSYFREPRGGFRFCERYTSTSSSIYNGLFGEIKTTESYQDSVGTWITTYVPIQDKSGNIIGAMGMDVSVSYVEEIKSQIRRGMLISFFSIYPILLMLILLTFRANKRLMVNMKQKNEDITLNAP